MNMTNKEYAEFVKARMPASPIWRDCLLAFLIGGLICCLGQLITDGWTALGLGKEDAGTAATITMVFLGALSTGLGFYDDLAKYGGAGTLVPITGFANAVASPALEFKTEGLITGTAVKIFTIAGPVIVCGIVSSVVYGLILCIFGV
ncbi:MAG: stage V sporulation protein AC [Oscillospiraceae bacterium]|nr:stage V sporulation protein AC [Oscillospiraceae bacterium]